MSAPATRRSPYVGLVPYSEEDWDYFFGREAETELIIANLMAARLTLLYGASGCGKSSVLRAGVVHRLRQVGAENLVARGTPEFALVVYNAWRDDPLAGLQRAMHEAVARSAGVATESLIAATDLPDTLRTWSARAGGELLVILDQFEEYFLYHAAEDGPGTFAFEFPRLVNRDDLRVNFLVAIREDALARLDSFKGRIPNLFDNYLRLHHLGLKAAEDAVREPVKRFNALYPDESMAIDDALVPELLKQTHTTLIRGGRGSAAAPEGGAPVQIETPYLQMVMTRLWDEEQAAGSRRLRHETLIKTLGGAEHIVRTHLDREMAKFTDEEKDVAARAFYFLVTPSGSKIALAVEDLAGYTELPAATLATVLERLVTGERRILRPVPVPERAEATRYELFHDVLGPAIADWRQRHEALQEKKAIRREEEKRRRAELQASEERWKRRRKIAVWVVALCVGVLLKALESSQAFQIAMILAGVYLALALMCSVLNEWVAGLLNMRAKNLLDGVRKLLYDSEGTGLAKQMYNHPLIKNLGKPGELPSYVPSRTFALALFDLVLPAKDSATPGTVQDIRKAVDNIADEQIKSTLVALIDDAEGDLKKARENVEQWYDDAMDRVSGWYKKKTQVFILVWALAVTLSVNADTILIANMLAHDTMLRASLVTMAETSANEPLPQRVQQMSAEIKKLGLPIGWSRDPNDPMSLPSEVGGWVLKIIGLLLTTSVVSLCAPFLFDTMIRLVNLRSTGNKPE